MSHITVIGAGPLGQATTRSLLATGHDVTVATRSGTAVAGAQSTTADVTTPDGLASLPPSGAIVACCGFPYTVAAWQRGWPVAIDNLIAAAEQRDATLVVTGNHYAYARGVMPMRATDKLAPSMALGAVRAEVSRRLFEAHAQGRIRAVEVRGSNYIGPEAPVNQPIDAQFVRSLVAKGSARTVGSPHAPHTWTAVSDFGRLLARAATDPAMAGRAWHVPSAPAVTQLELAAQILHAARRDGAPRLSAIPPAVVRLAGLFSPMTRAFAETLYQFTEPFIADDADTRELLGETHTPLEETVRRMVAAVRP